MKKYNFIFNEEASIKEFKKQLEARGLSKPSLFKEFVLKHFPDKKETQIQEYYSRRFCTDDDILLLLHNELGISLNEIYLPNSSYYVEKSYDILKSEFFILNELEAHIEEKNKEYIPFYNYLISRYNYLLQKYKDSFLSTFEKSELDILIQFFTGDLDSTYLYINNNRIDFLNSYYKKYPIPYFNEIDFVDPVIEYKKKDNITAKTIFEKKNYLNKLIDYEGISTNQLCKITGKSISVVSAWKNLKDPAFPMRNELVKLSLRLGVRIDDIYMLRYPSYLKNGADSYSNYIIETPLTSCLSLKIKEMDARFLLNEYISDVSNYISLIKEYIKTDKINIVLFNQYSKKLKVKYCNGDEELMEIAPITLNDLACFKEALKEEDSRLYPYFEIVYADEIILQQSENDFKIAKDYFHLLKEIDSLFSYHPRLKNKSIDSFLDSYISYRENKRIRDNGNRLLKYILREGARTSDLNHLVNFLINTMR